MRFSNFVAMNDLDMLQAYDVLLCYKRHLSIIYDKIIGTPKGNERFKFSDEE